MWLHITGDATVPLRQGFAIDDLIASIPQPKDAQGTPYGSVTAQLVEWCQKNGFQTHMYAADLFILDLSWESKNSQEIKDRLKQIRDVRSTPVIDAYWTKVYVDAYIAMLEQGAELTVTNFIRSSLLYELLNDGPIFANICSTAIGGKGRSIPSGLRKSTYDDAVGNVGTHSVIIYGCNDAGDFLVADPWDGLVVYGAEELVLSIEAAQIECDNQIFTITKIKPQKTYNL